jgi:hypothetical protein
MIKFVPDARRFIRDNEPRDRGVVPPNKLGVVPMKPAAHAPECNELTFL